jgi:hypothetical protein
MHTLVITIKLERSPDAYNYYELEKLIRGELDTDKIKFTLDNTPVYEDTENTNG